MGMKKYFLVFLMLLGSFVSAFYRALAASPPTLAGPSGLALIEIKITGNEFVMLQNNTGAAISDLSRYWLYDFNNTNPLAAGVSTSNQQLPAGTLAPGQTVLLNSSGGNTCGAAVTAKLALSLTDSGGFLQVIQTNLVNGVLQQTPGDSVSWSSGANTTSGMIANVPSSTADPAGAYYRYQNTSTTPPFLWQASDVDSINLCQLDVKISGSLTPGPTNPGSQFLTGLPPPAVFVQATDDASQTSKIPASDIGLAAPIINEILPNPAPPQSDNEDEFIELYNSNDQSFDLTGFSLQVGTRTPHNFTFPSGTMLPAHGFAAFYSIDTGLSLSNTGGQARLLDPLDNIISQTDLYDSAKEGQAWALANGQWYWTISPTPNDLNTIELPQVASETTTTPTVRFASPASQPESVITPAQTTPVAAKTTTGRAKAPSTTKPPTARSSTRSSQPSTKSASTKPPAAVSSNNAQTPISQPKPTLGSNLHWGVLAGVGALALLYGLYEYRHDLGNRLYQLRRYRETRRTARQAAPTS